MKRAAMALELRNRLLHASAAATATSSTSKRTAPSAFVEVNSKKAKASSSSSSSSSSGQPPADDGMDVEPTAPVATATNVTAATPISRPILISMRTPNSTPSPAPAAPVDEAVAEAHAYVNRLMASTDRNKIERMHGAEMLKAKREQNALQRQLAAAEAENKRLRSAVATTSLSGVQQIQDLVPDAQQQPLSNSPAGDDDAAGDAELQSEDSASTTDPADNDWTRDSSEVSDEPSGDNSSSPSNSDTDADEDRRDRKRRRRHVKNARHKPAVKHSRQSRRNRRYAKDALDVYNKLKSVLPAWEKPSVEKPTLRPWLSKMASHLQSVIEYFPSDQWYRIIMYTVPVSDSVSVVDREELAKILRTKPKWDLLMTMLMNRFDRIDHEEQLRTKFASIRQGNRSVSEYNNVFRSMMEELGLSTKQSTYNEQYLKGLDRTVRDEFHRQRDTIRHAEELQHGLNAQRSSFNSVLENVMLVCERISFKREEHDRSKHHGGAPGANGGGDKPKHQQPHRDERAPDSGKLKSNKNRNKFLKRKRGDDKKHCKVHGWCGHSSNECRSLNQNKSDAGRAGNKNDRPPVKCHICQGPHYANKCDKRGHRDQRPPFGGANNSKAGTNGSQAGAANATGSGASPWVSKQQYKAQVKQMKAVMKEIKEMKINKQH